MVSGISYLFSMIQIVNAPPSWVFRILNKEAALFPRTLLCSVVLLLTPRWNDAAKIYHFVQGLNSTIKDELAKGILPSTLEEVVTLCTRLDTRLFQRRLECGREHGLGYFGNPSLQSSTTTQSF